MILLQLNNKLKQQSSIDKRQHDFIERLFNDIQEAKRNDTNTRTSCRADEKGSSQS